MKRAKSAKRLEPWCSFGVCGTGRYTPSEAQISGERVHQDFDLIWIIEGAPTWIINGITYDAKGPCVILARPGMRDQFTWDADRISRNCYIHFTPRYALAHIPEEKNWPLLTRLPADDVVRPLLRHLVSLLGSKPTGWESLAGSALAHVIGTLCTGTLQSAELGPTTSGPMAQHVAEHLARIWGRTGIMPNNGLRVPTLGNLAAAARLTREGFCRAFQREVGLAPLQALRLIRLEWSARLLADGGLSVTQVANRCGFGDPFNFSRVFQTSYHCSPREFHERHHAGKVHVRLGGPEAFDHFRLCLFTALRWKS